MLCLRLAGHVQTPDQAPTIYHVQPPNSRRKVCLVEAFLRAPAIQGFGEFGESKRARCTQDLAWPSGVSSPQILLCISNTASSLFARTRRSGRKYVHQTPLQGANLTDPPSVGHESFPSTAQAFSSLTCTLRGTSCCSDDCSALLCSGNSERGRQEAITHAQGTETESFFP